ncbi:MAG: SBBP repeat-containing protein, partial [Acidobacteriota bacterium]
PRLAAADLVPAPLRLVFEGSDPLAQVTPVDPLPGRVNYFRGSDPGKWRSRLPTYGGLVYRQLYPGIDLSYRGRDGHRSGTLKGTFLVAAGADPSRIRWRYEGVQAVRIEESTGDLVIRLGSGTEAMEVVERAPLAWQQTDEGRRPVEVAYRRDEGGAIGFWLGPYDASRALTLDPELEYSTFFGGSDVDRADRVAVDSSGQAYITGDTFSSDLPTAAPLQPVLMGEADAFVAKFTSDGSALVYSTYLGGTDVENPAGIAVDLDGNAYVTGLTLSRDFPTVNPFQGMKRRLDEGFVSKLSPDGSALIYSTYLGGSGDDFPHGIAVDAEGSAYVAGQTGSEDFPVIDPIQPLRGNDAFIAKFDPDGASLLYSTFIGGSGSADNPTDIAVDPAGNACITGWTGARDFPLVNPLQDQLLGDQDAYVVKINAAGTALIYSTYLGGGGSEFGRGIAADGQGNAYVTGDTSSLDFPILNAVQPQYAGGDFFQWDGFLSKIDPTGSSFIYSTFIGGTADDESFGVAADAAGNAYLTGETKSPDFPAVRPFPFAEDIKDDDALNAFVAKLRPDGKGLLYSSLHGGDAAGGAGGTDIGWGIAVDGEGDAYVAGSTGSPDFPLVNPFQAVMSGSLEAFLSKIVDPACVTNCLRSTAIELSSWRWGRLILGLARVRVRDENGLPVAGATVTGAFSLPEVKTAVSGAAGVATFLNFQFLGPGDEAAVQLVVTGIDKEGFEFDTDGSVLMQKVASP